MKHPGWALILLGAVIGLTGAVLLAAPKTPWLGKLPGDVAIERDGFRFYFPVTTCIVLSLLLTGGLWLVRFFGR